MHRWYKQLSDANGFLYIFFCSCFVFLCCSAVIFCTLYFLCISLLLYSSSFEFLFIYLCVCTYLLSASVLFYFFCLFCVSLESFCLLIIAWLFDFVSLCNHFTCFCADWSQWSFLSFILKLMLTTNTNPLAILWINARKICADFIRW